MKAKIKSARKQNIDVLLDKLQSISTLEKNNTVSFAAFDYTELEWTFLSIIEFENSLSTESRKQILSKTLRTLVKENRFEKNYFLEQLEVQINHHNNKEEKTYFLLTSLSIASLPFRKLTLGEGIIYIHGKQFPNVFKKHRNTFIKSHDIEPENNNLTKLSIEIKSRDFKDAYEKSFQIFDIFRSLLCLLLNSQLEIRFGERTSKPINKVRQGFVSTLHTSDGNLAHKNYYWYVQDYREAKILELDNKKNENLKTNIKWLISCYNKCKPKHQDTIGKALINYVGAFDENNKYICFLRAWTVLEILSDTDQNDLLIKRCTAMFEEKNIAYQKQKLESLRLYRNVFVHEGGDGLDPMIACFNIQFFIYTIIVNYNFYFSGFFDNIGEACLFLDNYSPDIRELKKRKKILDRALLMKMKKRNANTTYKQ